MKELRFCEEHRYRYEEAAHVTPNSRLYEAQDLTLNRTVALKKVKISGTGRREIEGNYRRALQEVKTMVQISENTVKLPNIFCTWYEEQAAELFIVMQWIGGETLAKKMERTLSPVLFIKWMRELCQILDVMAVRGFVHKDIKPENIMFDKNNDLYLIDFNISVSVPNQKALCSIKRLRWRKGLGRCPGTRWTCSPLESCCISSLRKQFPKG